MMTCLTVGVDCNIISLVAMNIYVYAGSQRSKCKTNQSKMMNFLL